MTQLRWLDPENLPYDALHRLVADVAALGGAVGWLSVPDRLEVAAHFDAVLARGARLVVIEEGDRVVASAYWRRWEGAVLQRNAVLSKLMTASDRRGCGLGRQVTRAVIDDAREAGIEVLTLDCRGNNHGALRLYESLGFVVSGRRPDFIAVGDERFDQVLLHLDLRSGSEPLTRHGARREGPGLT